ncbi:MAG TPA: cytochrome o ubiquinol oxidase subunit III [Candidatus Saccharimonadales bacterium]|nr:cytochrome o ubiquinol oxidase subunit III [Candidatus Saccharimonadales bacterium]
MADIVAKAEPMGHEAQANDKILFGFWVYLMTDLLLFSVLFATFSVLRNNTYGGPAGRELFELPSVLAETLILLTSSFTCGLGMIAARAGNKKQVLIWFSVTFLLGLAFLGIEITEFSKFIHEGHGPHSSAAMSSFFTLVGTHGLHITSGLLWMAITMIYILKRGLNNNMVRKLTLLSLFWHFLDIVWIFIFTIVYLMAFV